jgi:lipid-A-disaccharide synthase
MNRDAVTSLQVHSDVLIVAAEASSSLYAQRLIQYWKKQNRKVKAFGIGSDAMEQEGFERFGRSEELAVVGFVEVIKHIGPIRNVFWKLVAEAAARKPKFALLLDYPDFNLRLAKELKKLGIPVVYYISPQVWAWRKSRINTIQKVVDQMLVVLPFEKGFYEKHNVEVEFVGHPILDEISKDYFDQAKVDFEKQKFGFKKGQVVVGLMPGSRHSEIKYNLDAQLQAASELTNRHPDWAVALLVAPSLTQDHLQKYVSKYDFPLRIIKADPFYMVSMMDAVIVTSGTATLTVGLLKVPMAIMYKINPITAWLAKILIRGVAFFGLPNLILNKLVCREFFQSGATGPLLADEIERLVMDKSYRDKMKDNLSLMRVSLGNEGATARVSRAIDHWFGS